MIRVASEQIGELHCGELPIEWKDHDGITREILNVCGIEVGHFKVNESSNKVIVFIHDGAFIVDNTPIHREFAILLATALNEDGVDVGHIYVTDYDLA